ncbi:putative ribonuclease H-like domain-containing protein [Tanacetum coccineum]
MPPKHDLSLSGIEEFVNEHIVSDRTVKKPVVEYSEAKASAVTKPKVVKRKLCYPILEVCKGNLVRGLPSKLLENDQTYVACQKGKQHRASCKSKTMITVGLVGFSSQATKDETSGILKSFITGVENLIDQRVKVIRIEAIRLFLAYASFKDFVVYQMDVKSAFLYGKIEEEVYVCQPPGFEDSDFPDRVYKVEKALYILHQAPRAWYETLSTYLLDNRFQRGKIDKTLFIKRDKSDIMLVQVYVDYIIFGSTRKKMCTEFEKMMHKKFQMSSIGELIFFLGLQVKQKEDRIFISQDKYVNEILNKFGFSDINTASTPMETHKTLLKDVDSEDVDEHIYRSMIGSLMYLTSSRPDIMFAVCACVRFQVNPKISHLHAVKMIFRYLKGQPKLGLWYHKDSPFDLVAYTDSDYAGASLDRKSTTGGCQFLGFRLISWQCKKQTVVANSTTEAEYIAAFNYFNGKNHYKPLEDGKKIIITEATVRRDLQLEDDDGVDCLLNATIVKAEFLYIDTDLVEGSEVRAEGSETREESSSKRAGDELEQENAKKQKMDDDQEAAKMKELIKNIPNKEEVAVDAIPLATKPPSIVDWKIVKEGKISYYQIIRADRSSRRYSAFIQMLRSFDREDLETLWKLVKAKHGYTRPEEGYESVLWGDLKTMFEHHVEDAVWRNLRESKVLVWKLFDSCGVHFVRFQNLHVFMLVEKRYPLTPATITDILNKKPQADHFIEMGYQLLKLITKQLKNQ